MLWRVWLGAAPASVLYVLTAVALFSACIGLLWLFRRQSLWALLVPSAVFVGSLTIWWLAFVHGRSVAIDVCQDAIDYPVGEYVQVLRQIGGHPEPKCTMASLVRDRWYVRIDSEDVVVASMWLGLDGDNEMRIRRVEQEALRATQQSSGSSNSGAAVRSSPYGP